MGKQENRGGAREGAGRPRIKKTYSEKVKAAYMKAAAELAKEYGEPIEKAVLRLAYEESTQDTVKIAVLKAYNEALLVKETEQNVNVNKSIGPTIGLPPNRPDPVTKTIKPKEEEQPRIH